jgi:hypothetical protein
LRSPAGINRQNDANVSFTYPTPLERNGMDPETYMRIRRYQIDQAAEDHQNYRGNARYRPLIGLIAARAKRQQGTVTDDDLAEFAEGLALNGEAMALVMRRLTGPVNPLLDQRQPDEWEVAPSEILPSDDDGDRLVVDALREADAAGY